MSQPESETPVIYVITNPITLHVLCDAGAYTTLEKAEVARQLWEKEWGTNYVVSAMALNPTEF